jgi:hypothetical protein
MLLPHKALKRPLCKPMATGMNGSGILRRATNLGARRARTASGALGALICLAAATSGFAQTPVLPPALLTPPPIIGAPLPNPPAEPPQAPASDPRPRVAVSFNAIFAPGDIQAIRTGLHWRVFDARAGEDGVHGLVAESNEATPTFQLPDGDYIVHAACGLAGADKPFAVNGAAVSERLVMNAGALKIEGRIGDAPIPASRLSIMVYLPDRDDPEAKLIIPSLKADSPECLPEGAYHVVSRLMDATPGSTTPTTGNPGNCARSASRAWAEEVLSATTRALTFRPTKARAASSA